ncbi:MAG: hypothetical protein MI749_10025, partial [Desulfovibrionales bacterium]|nr:hypothetical protein [Desulfovibrionales bacterium]
GMINLLGQEDAIDSSAPISLINTSAHLHWYNKTTRPGRKLGHVNVSADSGDELDKVMAEIKNRYLEG